MRARAFSQALQSLRQDRVIVLVPEDERFCGFYSNLVMVPQKDGRVRPILDLKLLNRFVKVHHFRMESLRSVIASMEHGEFLASIDIRDAYLHIPIFPPHERFLRFAVGEEHFQFTTLPFGLATAPRVFTKVMAAVMAILHSRGLVVLPYLDDLLVKGLTRGVCSCGICKCASNYTGSACGCSRDTSACMTHDGICSGHGKCECNKCVCDKGYFNKLCSDCPGCQTPCQNYSTCVECKAFTTGPQKESCSLYCARVNVTMIKASEWNWKDKDGLCQEKGEGGSVITFHITEDGDLVHIIVKEKQVRQDGAGCQSVDMTSLETEESPAGPICDRCESELILASRFLAQN
ncbi:unnamed protein product [Ranitomeya imitator]|uniref:ribonuclease H n=1 Tax=Ranitomeya imitator TaxID=111125 RepID=A0ABN9LHZ2_9NEOB|nr:unnamed protein product [Ranitomeya imitator]